MRFWPTTMDSAYASGSLFLFASISEMGLPSASLAACVTSLVGLPLASTYCGAPSTWPTTSALLPVAIPPGSPFAVDAIELAQPVSNTVPSNKPRSSSESWRGRREVVWGRVIRACTSASVPNPRDVPDLCTSGFSCHLFAEPGHAQDDKSTEESHQPKHYKDELDDADAV